MMSYEWVSVTEQRYIDAFRANYAYFQTGTLIHQYQYVDDSPVFRQIWPYLVQSIVQDFREAVGAQLYDEAKDDPTLIPSSCLIHVDAMFWFHFLLETGRISLGGVPLAPGFKDARRRAVIFRREQSEYLKRSLVGEVFPEELPGEAPKTPYYTKTKANPRSL